jgi:succinate dehydrogenase/fumarate reductase flavoprotein subunit
MSQSVNRIAQVETDLVVVGYGAAGAAAALTAARLGASVALIEKQAEGSHFSNTRLSGGLFMGVNDTAAATVYLDQCAGGFIPIDISRTWADRAAELRAWCAGHGLQSVRMAGGWYPQLEGYESVDVYAPLAPGVQAPDEVTKPPAGTLDVPSTQAFGNGETLHQWYVGAVQRQPGVHPYFGHSATSLVQDGPRDRVTGVDCSVDGETRRFFARRGVILACGGYGQDEDMVLNYLKAFPIYFYGNPFNTGDGVRMAQEVGADLWHMNQMIGRAVGHFALDEEHEFSFNISLNPPGYVITDRYGNRFANEWLQAVSKPHFYYELLSFDADRLQYTRIPSFWFFDERRMRARPLTSRSVGVVAMGLYDWSPDNEKEVASGWIKKGSTIEEVAAAAGVVDPQAAARAIADYNAGCAGGGDSFGRPADSLVPLDQPPFYCVPLYPGGANTNGGPRRDAQGHVLDPSRRPIPGLFGAGELGGCIGLLYPSPGANLSEAFVFGQIAAETALEGS